MLERRDAAHYLKAKWGKDGLHYDLIEDTPVYRRIIAEVKEEIVKRVGKGGYMGYCHLARGVKREVLLEKYGIIWHSPASMNPDVMFDSCRNPSLFPPQGFDPMRFAHRKGSLPGGQQKNKKRGTSRCDGVRNSGFWERTALFPAVGNM